MGEAEGDVAVRHGHARFALGRRTSGLVPEKRICTPPRPISGESHLIAEELFVRIFHAVGAIVAQSLVGYHAGWGGLSGIDGVAIGSGNHV